MPRFLFLTLSLFLLEVSSKTPRPQRCNIWSKQSWCAGMVSTSSHRGSFRHPCEGSGQQCRSGLHGSQIERLLAQHNSLRAIHGACPLHYSTDLEETLIHSRRFETMCRTNTIPHWSRAQTYGEIGYRVPTMPRDVSVVDTALLPYNAYCGQERCMLWRARRPMDLINLPQVIWKDTTVVGCGLCGQTMLCWYDGTGNKPYRFDWQNVGHPQTQPQGCAAAPQAYDECKGTPCGTQICRERDLWRRNDFICTCLNASISRVGRPAQCTLDECTAAPCGAGQTCHDPDTSIQSKNDFVCSCSNVANITSLGSPAMCPNECDAQPCGQLDCMDPTPEVGMWDDFICSCENGVNETAGPPDACIKDDCKTHSCGAGQTCHDMDTAANSVNNHICFCEAAPHINATGRPVASCPLDECTTSPCGAQACHDPVPTAASLHDFVCTCLNGEAAVSAPAVCEIDECRTGVCNLDNACHDPNTHPHSTRDYICSCNNDPTRTQTGAPAVCIYDECAYLLPCGAGQTCTDSNHEGLKGDYICTCADRVTTATGTPARCVYDECTAHPCGVSQTCLDPDIHQNGTYYCTCPRNLGSARGAAAVCDECSAGVCNGHICKDPAPSSASLDDFTCTCKTGAGHSIGKVPDCKPATDHPNTATPADYLNAASSGDSGGGGTPVWVWVLVVLAGVALLTAGSALLFVRCVKTPPARFGADTTEPCVQDADVREMQTKGDKPGVSYAGCAL